MKYREFKIIYKEHVAHDTYIIRLQLQNPSETYDFNPGQHAYLKFGSDVNNNEGHPFSIASSPDTKEYIEFCIKILGDWTGHFVNAKIGDPVAVSEPTGTFIWDNTITHACFMIGGVGVSPFMSMLRYIATTGKTPKITLIWGNRDEKALVYEEELKHIVERIGLRVVHVFSHLDEKSTWKGYRGFINESIVAKEVDLTVKPIFFLNGPPIFITHAQQILHNLGVSPDHIRTE